jgi:hypothetical protein
VVAGKADLTMEGVRSEGQERHGESKRRLDGGGDGSGGVGGGGGGPTCTPLFHLDFSANVDEVLSSGYRVVDVVVVKAGHWATRPPPLHA